MKKRFKVLRINFALMLLLSLILAACSSESSQTSENDSNDSKGTEEYDLTVAFPYFYGEPADMELVQDEINKIVKEKINATVDFVPLSLSAYRQQMNLMLTSNEKLDLAVVLGDQLSPQVSRGQLHEIDDQIEKYGKGIVDAVGTEYLNATKVDGKQYSVPSVRDLASSYGFVMVKEIVDKYNIDVNNIKTLEDMGEVLRKVKENEPDMTPLVSTNPGTSIVENLQSYDLLSDGNGVLPNYDNDLKVTNLYEMPEYVDMLKTIREWYQEGLILKDIATTQTTKNELVKAGKVFAWTNNLKPGIENQQTREIGKEVVAVEIVPPVATTSQVTNIMWGVPRNSENPEKAVEFLNLLYTDKEVFNLLNWGIEGKHYVKVSDEVIKYPEGVTSENVKYSFNTSWLFGNAFLSYVFEGENPDIWEETKKFNEEALKSKALGFNFNSDPVRTEFATVTNVLDQFQLGLETGTVDFDKQYPKFIEQLEAAGIEKIMKEKQKQLDEWAKTNGGE